MAHTVEAQEINFSTHTGTHKAIREIEKVEVLKPGHAEFWSVTTRHNYPLEYFSNLNTLIVVRDLGEYGIDVRTFPVELLNYYVEIPDSEEPIITVVFEVKGER